MLAANMKKDGIFDLVYDSSANAFRAITPSNDTEISQSGRFEFEWKGFSVAASVSCQYHKNGNLVVLTFDNSFVNSNVSGSAFDSTTSVIPAIIRPETLRSNVFRVFNGGTETFGVLHIKTNGAFEFFSSAGQVSNNFSATGSKGLDGGQMVTYFIDDA